KLERRYVSVRSRIRAQTAHISLQISINVKEQEAKTNQKRHSYYGVSGCLTSYVFFCFPVPSFVGAVPRPAAVCAASVRGVLRISTGGRKRLFCENVIFLRYTRIS
ncbi:hypothetical protein, partial [Rhodobacter sp. JA431]|uniref:hypothetical protein n=1 Tax=Rhodobacter sp. JA431 TaxID=570013 RepID=UPI001BB05D75